MGCFRISFSTLELVFYGLSLFYLVTAVRLAGVVRREWPRIQKPPLTRRYATIADQAAFYIAIPPAVAIHELFHAIPVWVWGGEIIECGYGFYWGFVRPDRTFAPSQEWFISLAGTLGSLLFGLGIWLILRGHSSPTLRHFGRRALRFQIYFSLIYYPVFTAFTFIGDWRTIYNFRATPILSMATAVVHIGLLAWFWQAQRHGRFEAVAHETVEDEAAFKMVKTAVQSNPQDTNQYLQYIDLMRRGGAENMTKTALKRFLTQHPHSGEGHLQLALVNIGNKEQVPTPSAQLLEKALNLGLANPIASAQALQLLGKFYLDKGKPEAAVSHFSQALAHIPTDNTKYRAFLYYQRSDAYRHQHQYADAGRDIQQAISLLTPMSDEKLMATFLERQKVIQAHATSSRQRGGGDTL